jgi:hypothetical protein
MCFVVLRQTQSPKNDIDAQTQVKNSLPKFLNRLGASVADRRPYRASAKNKKGRREAGLVVI